MPYSIYLASPLGFLPYTRAYNDALVTLIESHGAHALDPWDTEEGRLLGELCNGDADVREIAQANQCVGRANIKMIQSCDGLLPVLTAYRSMTEPHRRSVTQWALDVWQVAFASTLDQAVTTAQPRSTCRLQRLLNRAVGPSSRHPSSPSQICSNNLGHDNDNDGRLHGK